MMKGENMQKDLCIRAGKLVFFCAVLVFLYGCTGNKILELSEKDSGRTFQVETGSFITIKLSSDPTTGYQWNFASPFDPALLGLCGDTFLSAADRKKTGVPGYRQLKFEVIAPGKASLDLQYVRPWERNGNAAGRFQVIFYCVGKAKSELENSENDLKSAFRRDQHGNDIRRKNLFE